MRFRTCSVSASKTSDIFYGASGRPVKASEFSCMSEISAALSSLSLMSVGISHLILWFFSQQPAVPLYCFFSCNPFIAIIGYNNEIFVALQYCYEWVRLYSSLAPGCRFYAKGASHFGRQCLLVWVVSCRLILLLWLGSWGLLLHMHKIAN